MEFEFDPAKSAANKDKHGIDFHEAQALWEDDDLVEVPSLQSGEDRFIAVGLLHGRYWSAIWTWRDGRIRLISVRRSREREVENYEAQRAG